MGDKIGVKNWGLKIGVKKFVLKKLTVIHNENFKT